MDPELLKIFEVKDFKKGDIILHQDDKADGMYIIKSGKVEVERDDKVLAAMGEGDFFGIMGLMLHEKRSATVRVVSDDLSAYFLSKEAYEDVKDELGEEIDKALKRYGETYNPAK